jgi:hypothetical protein
MESKGHGTGFMRITLVTKNNRQPHQFSTFGTALLLKKLFPA